jgi:hypothetical protein
VGKLIIRSGMTVDGVIDQTDRWFIPDGEHEDESYDQLFAADAFVLGRKTYQGLARVWPTITDDRGSPTGSTRCRSSSLPAPWPNRWSGTRL